MTTKNVTNKNTEPDLQTQEEFKQEFLINKSNVIRVTKQEKTLKDKRKISKTMLMSRKPSFDLVLEHPTINLPTMH